MDQALLTLMRVFMLLSAAIDNLRDQSTIFAGFHAAVRLGYRNPQRIFERNG